MPKLTREALSLKELLSENTAAAAIELQRDEDGVAIRCLACGHRCRIKPGRDGVCRVRFNRDHELRVPFGYVGGLAIDPIEKKPFYHAFPGRQALSFGMLGCDLHCSYCQNWVTSQALRDPNAVAQPTFVRPEQLVELAREHYCPVITSTYNEPLITAEWGREVFRRAAEHDIVGSMVSNGHGTPEVLEFLRPYMPLLKIDLKAFRDAAYRELGGVLENVLDTIRRAKALDYWLELVTLVVPGLNDSDDELRELADFIAGVSPEIPWHVTAFHPTYNLTDPRRTPPETLVKACEIGRSAGLQFVYAGNLPGLVDEWEHTRCPGCGEAVIRRRGFEVRSVHLAGGCCEACGLKIPGYWG